MDLSLKAKRLLIGVAILLLLTAVIVFWPFDFFYDSVCSQCGAIKDTRQWQLPFNHRTIFSFSFVETTPVSRYLTSSGAVRDHTHNWKFGHGGSFNGGCALGDGDELRATVKSPAVARLLDFSKKYGEPDQNAKLLHLTFASAASQMIFCLATDMPTNGFSSREQYRAWINDRLSTIDEVVEIKHQVVELEQQEKIDSTQK